MIPTVTSSPEHNSFSLPPGITEADLIDLIDGAVPSEREGVLIAALRDEPRLGLMVKRMRADRGGLEELGAVSMAAPAGLIEGIESKLNREALRELVAESEEAPAVIPISGVQPAHWSDGGPGGAGDGGVGGDGGGAGGVRGAGDGSEVAGAAAGLAAGAWGRDHGRSAGLACRAGGH
jgi:anti-sigma factor RsiW